MNRVTVVGRRNGVIAMLHVTGDAEWEPLDIRNRGKIAGFVPSDLVKLDIANDDGMFMFIPASVGPSWWQRMWRWDWGDPVGQR